MLVTVWAVHVRQWYMQNGLQLNPDKAKALVVGTSSQLNATSTPSSVSIAGTDLPAADYMKVLGGARLSSMRHRCPERATFMLTLSDTSDIYWWRNWRSPWRAASYCLGWTTATLCCTVPQPAAFRSCSTCRTQRHESFCRLYDSHHPAIWNSFNTYTLCSSSLALFKHSSKTFFFRQTYRPGSNCIAPL